MRLLGLAGAVLLSGCSLVRPDVAVAPKAEQDAAVNKWFVCLKSGARVMDDHVSDASTIGRTLVTACHGSFLAYWRSTGNAEREQRVQEDAIRSYNPSIAAVYQNTQQQDAQFELGFATRAVLEARQGIP